jgi:hypothetical protein
MPRNNVWERSTLTEGPRGHRVCSIDGRHNWRSRYLRLPLAVARAGIYPGSTKGQGFLLVVAIRSEIFHTGWRSPSDLQTDLLVRFSEKLVPAFKKRQYSKGIFDTIEAYIATPRINAPSTSTVSISEGVSNRREAG